MMLFTIIYIERERENERKERRNNGVNGVMVIIYYNLHLFFPFSFDLYIYNQTTDM